MADASAGNLVIDPDGRAFPPGPLLRYIEDLDHDDVFSERVYRLAEARVLFADYAVLQHDFPQLRIERLESACPDLRTLDDTRKKQAVASLLDRWLVRHTAFISRGQLKQQAVNTPIKTTHEHVVAYRPLRYRRALVFSLKANRYRLPPDDPDLDAAAPEGLLDVKGVGVAPHVTPHAGSHANGLLGLTWALFEYLHQRVIGKILRREDSPYTTLPIYGILDPGFDVIRQDGKREPAALFARRAHQRPVYPHGMPVYGAPDLDVELEIELMLRKYGITSVNPATVIDLRSREGSLEMRYGEVPIDVTYSAEELAWIRAHTRYRDQEMRLAGLNIQLTRGVQHTPPRPQLVDFGAYLVRERFEHPLVTLVADRPLRLGDVVFPDDPRYVQPDPALRVPYQFWGETREEGPALLCALLGRAYRAGRLTGRQVQQRLDTLVHTATSRWD